MREECDTALDLETYSYYEDFSRTSHSMLEVLIESPLMYYKRFVARTVRDDEDDEARVLGNALHSWLDNQTVVVAPKVDRRTKAGRAEWAAFCSENAGSVALTNAQGLVFKAMCRGVRGNTDACRLLDLSSSWREVIYFFSYRDGSPCKAKLDRLIPERAVIDLKTTTDPRPGPFHRQARRLGYYRQADWYLKATGVRKFYFIAQRKSQPYDCWVYQVALDEIGRAGLENDAAMDELRTCLEFDCWTSRSDGINILGEVANELQRFPCSNPRAAGEAHEAEEG